MDTSKIPWVECVITLPEQIEENFKDDILIDDALFYIAELYQYYLNNSTEAKDYYERIVLKHKDSTFSIEARKRYRKLRGDV